MGIKDSGVITRVKQKLTAVFEMADMGPISFYLGLKVIWDQEKKIFKLSLPVYIDKILAKFHLNQAKISNTPIKETPLLLNEGKEATVAKKECYQRKTGSIMFLRVETRPNIAYAMLVVSRFVKNPSYLHSKVVKTVFCYLKATKDVGITYGREQGGDLIIKGYSDSNWTSDYVTRKSTSGFIFILNGGPVS